MTAPISEAMQKPASQFDHAAPSGLDQFAADARVIVSGLTSDNLHLSKPILSLSSSNADIADSQSASDAKVREFLHAAQSANTRHAYKCDLDHFVTWGGQLPTVDREIARYLADHAGLLSIATLRRRLVAIRSAHIAYALQDPTKSELVRLTFRGIRRIHGRPERRVAALGIADLRAIVSALGPSMGDIRDSAILLIGFAGAFRRSELAAINWTDVGIDRAGALIGIPRSKTDQEGQGRNVVIPRGDDPICPVAALERWLAVSRSKEGAVFRAVTKAGKVMPKRLSSNAIARVVKARVQAIGRDASRYSGHSLRAGFATAAAAAGIPQWRIKAQTGHRSDATLGRYIREGEITAANGLAVIFDPLQTA